MPKFYLGLCLGLTFLVATSSSLADVTNCGRILFEFRNYERHHYDPQTEDQFKKLDPTVPTLVVVDGLSSGADYAILARRLFPHINIIHIQTSERLAPGLADSFQPKTYDANIIYDARKVAHLAQLLAPFKAAGLRVVAGTETSPLVRAILTDRLEVPGTSLPVAAALNDKALAATLVSPYVKTIPGNTFQDAQSAWEWITQTALPFPVFPVMVKPVNAAGSFGVKVCHSKKDFFDAFNILRGKNPLGFSTTAMLVQPYFSREEYTEFVIDAVVDEQMGVTLSDILEYRKQEDRGQINYLTTRLRHLFPSDALYKAFLETAAGVAKGLQMTDGTLHIEVFVKNGTEPPEIYFIEAGARPAGGNIPSFVRACGGVDQITLHLLSMFDRPKFLQIVNNPMQFVHEGIQVELLGPKALGITTQIPSDEEFKEHIPGFVSHSLHLKPGAFTGPVEDMFQGPGVINVVGTEEQVEAAESAVRSWEKDGLYRTRVPRFHEKMIYRAKKFIKERLSP